ncbi:hypothetical protein LINGRAHAP2_LOCUS12726 [Linum grandiflorum]
MASSVEFHPQCVMNPPTATWSRIITCGAHPLIISPFEPIFSLNPSGSHSSPSREKNKDSIANTINITKLIVY